jgi:hypothetical protein
MREAIRELDRNGIPASRLKACEDAGRDGTRLPRMRQDLSPAPGRPGAWIFQLRIDDEQRPFLACLAFGVVPTRSWQPSVYQVAGRRLHAAKP